MEKRIKKVSFNDSTNESSVKSLLKRFESISVSEQKVELPKSGLARSQTMRNPSKFQHQKPRIVPKPEIALKNLKSPGNIYQNVQRPFKPPNAQSDRPNKPSVWKFAPTLKVEETIYENLHKNNAIQIKQPESLAEYNVYESIVNNLPDDVYETIEVDSNAILNQIPRAPSLDKVQMIISELRQNEVQYISNLRRGIEAYIHKLKFIQLPDTLVGKRVIIFSNIEYIFEFHKRTFLPQLIQCGFDPEKVANTFIVNIENSSFDQYILYAQNKLKSQELCISNKYFFKQLDKDALGINSFLLQPIQRLPRYRLIIDGLVKELLKDVKANKAAIARCCAAERQLNILLSLVDDQCK